MKPCSDELKGRMHDYLDGDLSPQGQEILLEHMKECESCDRYFSLLQGSESFLNTSELLMAPANFTQKVMKNLPKQIKKKNGFIVWVRKYPSIIAAAVFVLLMGSALTSYVTESNHLSYTKNSQLEVANNTVVVPEGVTIDGDIVVENGDLKIEGKVNGNVTVINGKEYLASVGTVTGDIKEVNEFFNWLWYKLKSVF
jgi:anti-sigma factor RsiW